MKVIKLKNLKYRKIAMLGLMCSASLVASQAGADILAASTNINPQASPPLANGTFLDLNSAAGNQNVLTFSTSAPNTRVMITFAAECIIGGGFNNYLDIDMFVDPAGPITSIPVAPTAGNTTAFCSGAGFPNPLPPGLEGFPSVVHGIVVIPTAGVHIVGARMTSFGSSPAPTWRIDDLSIVAQR